MAEGICEICGGNYSFKSMTQIGDSEYRILKCEKCGHQVARRRE